MSVTPPPPPPVPSPSPYRFNPTQDWFSHNQQTWNKWFTLIHSTNPATKVQALEIGSWQGRSAVYTLQNLCKNGGSITCVDHFDLFGSEEGKVRYQDIMWNLGKTGKSFRILDEFSVVGLMILLKEAATTTADGFDWIYIDGSHRSDDTFLDAELSWRLAKPGCIIVFDDYHWETEPVESIHHPKRGIDGFLQLHAGEFVRLSEEWEYQVVIRKECPARIGFLFKDDSPIVSSPNPTVRGTMDYGINVVATADSSYAPAVAVTLRSLLEHTKGRISVYLFDCGIHPIDLDKIKESLPLQNHNVTLNIVSSQPDGLTHTLGPTWAKIELLNILPVERVLYLDADVLVRKDVKPLWDIDMQGSSIAAIRDTGFPMGLDADEKNKKPYFNAGVLLLNLTQIRSRLSEIHHSVPKFINSQFKDQDLLNGVFIEDWVEVPLHWNAQGLGTYANLHTPDREYFLNELEMVRMKTDPSIVHFTGPLHPPMVDVLNPYLQPYTSKPWGYAGCPGNPYASEWWDVVESETCCWKGMRESAGWKEECERKRKEAEGISMARFHEILNSVKDA